MYIGSYHFSMKNQKGQLPHAHEETDSNKFISGDGCSWSTTSFESKNEESFVATLRDALHSEEQPSSQDHEIHIIEEKPAHLPLKCNEKFCNVMKGHEVVTSSPCDLDRCDDDVRNSFKCTGHYAIARRNRRLPRNITRLSAPI